MEINSADVATGEYKVKIESFNANYQATIALLTDDITIRVQSFIRDSPITAIIIVA